jgi:chromosome segregation protein
LNSLRLKSLELNGYKTFASKTIFEFAGPITAIVGPNGSGKSNIADALRWVLGEQAFSLLRGRKTEDMIFSGSEKRPRAGMASATVTFDNSDGWLPIDFSEVTITRRAYRDGKNEYLINNQQVRLRDVNELLAQSALAERTYTVIGQGLIDSALSLSSDERRRLFEEAAGIGLYRGRKEQSQRRLDATRRNLERVEDILAELKPRLRSLERQAKRALEFSSLREEMRTTLRTWYGYHWNRAQQELTSARASAQEREQTLGLARQKQSELSKELSGLRGRSQELRSQLNQWHGRLAELRSGREGASRQLAVADERLRALGERREALKQEQQRLSTEQATLEARLQESQREVDRMQEEFDEAQGRLNEAQAALNERQSAHQEREAEGQRLRENLAQLEGQRNAALAKREQLEATQAKLSQEVTDVTRALAQADEELAAAEQDVANSQKVASQATDALDEADADLQTAEAAIAAAEAERHSLDEQQRQLVNRQSKFQGQLRALQEAELAAAGFAEGARKLQDAAHNQRLKLARGTLGREISLDAELEAAVAAALGHYLDAVALIDAGDAETALSVLEADDAAAMLLPLNRLSANGRLQSPGGNGVLGVAADLVQAPSELQPAVELLLGNVLLVRDRAAAQRVLSDLPDGARAVTLRGEVFHRNGPIEVRSQKAGAGLARPREERRLQEELTQLEARLAQNGEQLEANNSILAELRQAEQEARRARQEAATAAEAARAASQTAQLEVAQLEKQRDWFAAQQRGLQRQLAEGEEGMTALETQAAELQTSMAAARQQIDLHNNDAAELPMDEHRAQAAHWEMRKAVSQRALQETERRRNERQEQLTHNQQQQGAETAALAELDRQEKEIHTEKVRLRAEEGEVGGEIGEIQSQLGPAEAELADVDGQQDSLQRVEVEAIAALSGAERANTQAQIALARQQEALQTLRGRIEDDFGLVAFDYEETVSGPTPLPLGNLVEHLPKIDSLEPGLEDQLKEQRAQIRRLGAVNPEAEQEFRQVQERVETMTSQVTDLKEAEEDLQEVIAELDMLMTREFKATFEKVATEFRSTFSRLFQGGAAKLLLTDEEDFNNTGIDIEARLPGKRPQRLALLSGGERSLTATALVFALLKASPTPFCVMDEVDAMLDEANVGRFTQLLEELAEDTQFVLITHNRNTVQAADVIYGITMGRDTASQMISLRLDEVDERYSSG